MRDFRERGNLRNVQCPEGVRSLNPLFAEVKLHPIPIHLQ